MTNTFVFVDANVPDYATPLADVANDAEVFY
jgi:hypothetical protein